MAKQNTKSSHKNINKADVAKRLETATKHVLQKNIFFSVKNKNGFFDIVDATTKKPVLVDVFLPETARHIVDVLIKTSKKRASYNIHSIKKTLDKYQPETIKHFNDLIFYKYTMKTTKDREKFFIVETRADIALMRLRDLKKDMHSRLQPSY